jgi:hypothetical protein
MYQPYFLKRTAIDNQQSAIKPLNISLWFLADG